jgi:hypothetical protein
MILFYFAPALSRLPFLLVCSKSQCLSVLQRRLVRLLPVLRPSLYCHPVCLFFQSTCLSYFQIHWPVLPIHSSGCHTLKYILVLPCLYPQSKYFVPLSLTNLCCCSYEPSCLSKAACLPVRPACATCPSCQAVLPACQCFPYLLKPVPLRTKLGIGIKVDTAGIGIPASHFRYWNGIPLFRCRLFKK